MITINGIDTIRLAHSQRLQRNSDSLTTLHSTSNLGQVGKLFPLPIHSDQSDSEIEIIVNRGLYVPRASSSRGIGRQPAPDEALRELQLMGEPKLVHYFGSGNRVLARLPGQAGQRVGPHG